MTPEKIVCMNAIVIESDKVHLAFTLENGLRGSGSTIDNTVGSILYVGIEENGEIHFINKEGNRYTCKTEKDSIPLNVVPHDQLDETEKLVGFRIIYIANGRLHTVLTTSSGKNITASNDSYILNPRFSESAELILDSIQAIVFGPNKNGETIFNLKCFDDSHQIIRLSIPTSIPN